MSFLAVLLLEEARHWSHLTGTSVELFHLNNSSYMSAISFKGTDIYCPLHPPPRCQIKGSGQDLFSDTNAIYFECRKCDLICYTHNWNTYNWYTVLWSSRIRINNTNLLWSHFLALKPCGKAALSRFIYLFFGPDWPLLHVLLSSYLF